MSHVKLEKKNPNDLKLYPNDLNANGTVVLNYEDSDILLNKKGQTKPTPSPGSGDRVFYETLYYEKPQSFMAFKWCIEYGIFSDEQLKSLYPKYLTLKEKVKENKKRKAETSFKAVKKVAGLSSEDIGMSTGTGWETKSGKSL